MPNTRYLLIPLVVALSFSLLLWIISGSVSAAPLVLRNSAVKVDPAVWVSFLDAPDRQATFIVVMQESINGMPESAIDAQVKLVSVLEYLQRAGAVVSVTPYYGANIIYVTGSVGAVHFLENWPQVAKILPYQTVQALAEQASENIVAASSTANGHFTGVVTGPDGTIPLEGIRIRPYLQIGPTHWTVIPGIFTTFSNGSYDVGGLETGFYRVEFFDPAGNYVSEFYNNQSDFIFATNFSVTDGQTTSGINASLAQAGGISGNLTAINGGSPLADIVVSAWKYEGGTWKNKGSAVSASDGSYRVGGLLPGTYRVRFSDSYPIPRYIDEYYDNVLAIDNGTDVNVATGNTTSDINASLGSYGKITGHVTGPDGITPVSNLIVDVYEWDSGSSSWNLLYSPNTDESGVYISDGIDTQDYRIGFVDISGMYVNEFYNDKPDVNSANTINGFLGDTVSGIDASLTRQVMTSDQLLSTGWNLVNLALTESGAPPETVLNSIVGKYNVAYAWDNCGSGEWLSYNPDDPLGDLDVIDPSMGVWLDMTSMDTISLDGLHPITTTISLCTGWNLIGYPSVVTRPIEDVLGAISGKYDIVYAYDSSNPTNPWRTYNPNIPVGNSLKNMEPWTGYWIFLKQNAELEIPGH